tara:strand:+ start:2611 stop:3147 length:537 start_codon:yes stop_codon:yes gene_type:complete
MEIKKFSNDFKDVKIAHGINFEDERGSLKKTMYGDSLETIISPIKEVLCSTSKKNVIRGLHFQNPPYAVDKLVTCVKGQILDVFLDLRKESDNFGKYDSLELTGEDKKSVLIPKGFAHGYSTLSDEAIIVYLQSDNYNAEFDDSIDPLSLNISWKVSSPILSEKDKNSINFEDFNSKF